MPTRLEKLLAHRFVYRVLCKAGFGAGMALCMAWMLGQTLFTTGAQDTHATRATQSFEWPTQWDGADVRPLALSDVERRFADRFPGAMARLTDGTQVLVLRHVTAPTRMLHPATDCYRALGYRITHARLEEDAQRRRWRCFIATRAGGSPLRVCERITDTNGQAFTDTSAWYWAAVAGQSQGPWQAVTIASLAPTAHMTEGTAP